MSRPGWIKISRHVSISCYGSPLGFDWNDKRLPFSGVDHSHQRVGICLSAHPRVLIVVLNWNGKEDTIECLESLKLVSYSNFEVIIVDNGSTDGSVEAFRKRYPGTEVLETGKNLGYAGGNNIGIDRAMEKAADYVLILNNDTVVDSHFLDELVAASESDKRIGVCGPTVYDYGTDSRVQATGGMIGWSRGRLLGPAPEGRSPSSTGRILDVDIAHGCCMLIKGEVVKSIGSFDRDFFSHWDEIDYCARAKRAGYRVVWVENAKIWHKKGAARAKTSGFTEYFNSRNRLLFMRKNASGRQYLSFVVFYFAFELWLIEAFYLRRFRDCGKCASYLRGSIDGLLGRTGPGPWT